MVVEWWWRYGEERDTLWRSVVSKYREDGRGWVPCMAPRHWMSGLWGNILKVEMCQMFAGNLSIGGWF